MAFKHYIKTSATTGGDTTQSSYQVFNLVTVASGYELAVVNMKITSYLGGEVHLLVYRNNAVVSDAPFSIAANEVIYLDSKELYEAGDTLAMYATEVGVTVEVFGDYSAV